MLGINIEEERNGIQEGMLTEPEWIGHLSEEGVEGIQAACGGYAKRNLANLIFLVTRIQQKRLVLPMYWIKDQRRLRETTEIFNNVDETTLRRMIEESNERESCRK